MVTQNSSNFLSSHLFHSLSNAADSMFLNSFEYAWVNQRIRYLVRLITSSASIDECPSLNCISFGNLWIRVGHSKNNGLIFHPFYPWLIKRIFGGDTYKNICFLDCIFEGASKLLGVSNIWYFLFEFVHILFSTFI